MPQIERCTGLAIAVFSSQIAARCAGCFYGFDYTTLEFDNAEDIILPVGNSAYGYIGAYMTQIIGPAADEVAAGRAGAAGKL